MAYNDELREKVLAAIRDNFGSNTYRGSSNPAQAQQVFARDLSDAISEETSEEMESRIGSLRNETRGYINQLQGEIQNLQFQINNLQSQIQNINNTISNLYSLLG